jgi:hypothetical protein
METSMLKTEYTDFLAMLWRSTLVSDDDALLKQF